MTDENKVPEANLLDGIEHIEKGEAIVFALKQMLASEGWGYYIALLQKQIEVRLQAQRLTPLKDFGELFEQEFSKGEAAGMQTAMHVAPQMYEDFSEQLKVLIAARDADAQIKGDQDE